MLRPIPFDSGIGWLIAGLIALQMALALTAGSTRASGLDQLKLRPTLPTLAYSEVVEPGAPKPDQAAVRFAAIDPTAPMQRPTVPDVFGSVAIRTSPLAISQRWKQIIKEDAARFFASCPPSKPICLTANWPRWRDTARRAEAKSNNAQLAFVNSRVNALVRYTSDRTLYGRGDYWATLTETVTNGAGDCEDIAIAKMWMLNALGVPLSVMQIVALKDRRRGLDHAVLAVTQGESTYILDNVRDEVLEDWQLGHYQPVFSVSAAGSWIHGFRRQADQLSATEGLRGSLR